MNDAIIAPEDTAQFPVFVVMGQNWVCEVKMNPEDLVLNGEDLLIDEDKDLIYKFDFLSVEAATKAVEICHDLKEADRFEILDDEKEPYTGGVLYAFPKGGNPNNGNYIPSFIAYGNAGLYKEAKILYDLYQKELKAAIKQEKKPKKKVQKVIKKKKK